MTVSRNGQHPPDAAIIVENLGKQYHIGMREQRHDTLMHSAVSWLASPITNFRQLRRLGRLEEDDAEDVIWALRDVSFTINQGEVIGIIGRNGAGKSTLLKILSRITPPSTGQVTLNGRVSSLLEVGTGFHPELTGRENVYLNGTILGMTKSEIDRKFDEIVSFAEVEKFIDTPVKRYSNGMRVRLAFAVSAHLESEILLVDEVLAVGDAAFQEKCLNMMDGVARVGRTVLLVSHNMQVIQRLCTRAFLIQKGQLTAGGPPKKVVETYLEEYTENPVPDPVVFNNQLRLDDIKFLQDGYEVTELADNGKPLQIQVSYEVLVPIPNPLLGFDIFSGDGTQLYRTYDMLQAGMGIREPGVYQSIYELPAHSFQSGTYYFEFLIAIHRHSWLTRNEIRTKLNFDGVRAYDIYYPGVIQPLGTWHVEQFTNQLVKK